MLELILIDDAVTELKMRAFNAGTEGGSFAGLSIEDILQKKNLIFNDFVILNTILVISIFYL